MEWSNSSQPRSAAKLFTASAGGSCRLLWCSWETQHFQAMQALWTQFIAIRPVVDRVLEGNLSSVALDNVTTYAAAVEVPIESATNLYSSMTQTATMTPINLLVPLPMSGLWSPGGTMRVAAQIAQDLINQEQKVLPGYNIISDFFDDECDPDKPNRTRKALHPARFGLAWQAGGAHPSASRCPSSPPRCFPI